MPLILLVLLVLALAEDAHLLYLLLRRKKDRLRPRFTWFQVSQGLCHFRIVQLLQPQPHSSFWHTAASSSLLLTLLILPPFFILLPSLAPEWRALLQANYAAWALGAGLGSGLNGRSPLWGLFYPFSGLGLIRSWMPKKIGPAKAH